MEFVRLYQSFTVSARVFDVSKRKKVWSDVDALLEESSFLKAVVHPALHLARPRGGRVTVEPFDVSL